METIIIQLNSLFIYIISGMIIGVLFDFFRILRKSFHTPDFITYIEDILFWIITGIFLLFLLFNFSNGEIRIYTFLGLLIGIIVYMIFISKFIIKVSVTIVKFIKNIILKILSILFFPIKKLLKILKKIYIPFTFFVINIKKSISNIIKKITIKSKKQIKTNKKKKISRERRILERNVEKYK